MNSNYHRFPSRANFYPTHSRKMVTQNLSQNEMDSKLFQSRPPRILTWLPKATNRFHNGTIILSNHLFAWFHCLIISSSQHVIISISSSHHLFIQYYKNAERGERSEPHEAFAEQPSTSSDYLITQINVRSLFCC